jgi:phosphatidylserine decarboxylase
MSTAAPISPVSRPTVRPLPSNITSVQPGNGTIVRLELAWGRLRRWYLRAFRRGYVAHMHQRRQGDCPGCTHDIVDPRDLKFHRNVCGFRFDAADDRFAWRDRLGVTRVGLAEILVFGGFFLMLAVGALSASMLLAARWVALLAVAPAALLVFVVSFFRDPHRRIPEGSGVIVSPADGTIDDIEQLDHCEFLDGPAVKIGVFLSVFNVHVNRVPETSRVIELRYLPGKFGNALRRSTAAENEQLWIMLEAADPPHRRMLVKQIAGAIARRIVCEARPGEMLARGTKFGMIKFGSRTELYLPREGPLCLEAKLNQSVRGGSTVLARYGGDALTP